jgi:hypothetical protein
MNRLYSKKSNKVIMKTRILLSLFAIVSVATGYAQNISYSAATIPAALKERAHVIKRYENITFSVKDVDAATYDVHQIYTVLDEGGASTLRFREYTSSHRSINDVDIRVYDASGKQINRYKKKDLNKVAPQDGFSLIVDGNVLFLDVSVPSYPVTVEYIYEIGMTGTLQYPSYDIQGTEEAVEYSSYTAEVPFDLDLRYMEQKVSIKPTITNEVKAKAYKWEVKNMPAFKDEEGRVGSEFYYPSIILAPNKFRHFNTYGDMTSWKSFGQWGYELFKGLDELSAERKEYFTSMARDAKTEREKVALIYNYMQKNFRYVSIQLGIGGVKPFPAKFTDEKKYGDCKGLSLYMLAALKAVGIKSYCALINAEYNQEAVPESFPCDRFNHVILCVPQVKDSIWLECTSNTADFAILGTFTENRNALLLTENGGVLVSTPKSKASNNTITTSTVINLNEDGSGFTTTLLSSKGLYRRLINNMAMAKKDDQKKMIVGFLGFKQPDEFTINKKEETFNIDLKIEKIPQFSAGSKMFLNPRVNSLWKSVLPKAEDRKQDFYFDSPFIKADSTVYNLPDNYVAESVPLPADIKCEFGTYKTSYTYVKEKNQIVSVARLELTQIKIPSDKYADVKKFFDGVMSEDTQKMVIKKN